MKMKRSMQIKDAMLLNMYTSNMGEPNYIKQISTDIVGETYMSTTRKKKNLK